MLLFAGGYFWFGMSSSCTRVSRQPFDLNNQLKVIVISHQAPFHICISRNVRPASGSQQTHRFLHLEEARLLPLPIHFFLLNNLLPLNNRALLSMTILLAPSLLPLPLRILILLSLLPRPRCLSSPIAIIPGSLLGCPRCLRTRRSLLTIRRKSSIPTRIKVTFCQSICFFFVLSSFSGGFFGNRERVRKNQDKTTYSTRNLFFVTRSSSRADAGEARLAKVANLA